MIPGQYDPRWYLCDLQDTTAPQEPDWSRVPADRLERVKTAWRAGQKPLMERVNLWGPQIPFFKSLPYYEVGVLEEILR